MRMRDKRELSRTEKVHEKRPPGVRDTQREISGVGVPSEQKRLIIGRIGNDE